MENYKNNNINYENQLNFESQEIKSDDAGIEKEIEMDESHKIENPFDPKKVQFDQKVTSIDNLIKRIQHSEINLNTEFQRLPNLWNQKKQSQFVESILLRIPLPVFYFNGKDDGKWEVIDGLQRITTLNNFVIEDETSSKKLYLKDLEYLTKFNDYIYEKLPRELQRRIFETQVYVYIMREDTPDEVKFNVFKRINTGGIVLEPQEIRHALNQGIPSKFIKELADLIEFKEAICYSIKPERMKDRDLVTRFISFYQTSYDNYKPEPDLDSFLNKGMANLNQLSVNQRQMMKENFIISMKLSKEIFGDFAFRKILNKNASRNPINKALFESISVHLAKIDRSKSKQLKNNKEQIINDFIKLCNEVDFNKSISYATADVKRVQDRFKKINELFNKFIET